MMHHLEEGLENDEQLLFAGLLSTTLTTALIGGIGADSTIAWHSICTIGSIVLAIEFAIYGLWSRYKELSIALLIVLIALWAPIKTQQTWAFGLITLLVAHGFYIAVKRFRLKRSQIKWSLMMGLSGAAIVFTYSTAKEFDMTSWLYEGRGYIDTFFHASIASMLKNYGVNSTGVHGLVESGYYSFSHAIIGAISKLSGESTLQAYGVVPQLLLMPLLLTSISLLSLKLGKLDSNMLAFNWLIACSLLIIFPKATTLWGVAIPIGSESYCLSATLFISSIPRLWDKKIANPGKVLQAGALGAVLSAMKSSAAIELIISAGAQSLHGNLQRCLSGIAITSASIVGAIAGIVTIANSNQSLISFRLFGLIRGLTPEGGSHAGFYIGETMRYVATEKTIPPIFTLLAAVYAITSFFLIHLLLAWIALYCLRTNKGLDQNLGRVTARLLLGLTAACIATITFFDLLGGEIYLTSTITLIAIAVTGCTASKHIALPNVTVIVTILALIAFCISAPALKQGKSLEVVRKRYFGEPQINLLNRLVDIRNDQGTINRIFEIDESISSKSFNYPYLDRGHPHCKQLPFVFTSISERPWIGTLKLNQECSYDWYSYDNLGEITNGNPSIKPKIKINLQKQRWNPTKSGSLLLE